MTEINLSSAYEYGNRNFLKNTDDSNTSFIIDDDLTVTGALNVTGPLNVFETNELRILDPFIVIGADNTGAGAPPPEYKYSIIGDRGTLDNVDLSWYEPTSDFQINIPNGKGRVPYFNINPTANRLLFANDAYSINGSSTMTVNTASSILEVNNTSTGYSCFTNYLNTDPLKTCTGIEFNNNNAILQIRNHSENITHPYMDTVDKYCSLESTDLVQILKIGTTDNRRILQIDDAITLGKTAAEYGLIDSQKPSLLYNTATQHSFTLNNTIDEIMNINTNRVNMKAFTTDTYIRTTPDTTTSSFKTQASITVNRSFKENIQVEKIKFSITGEIGEDIMVIDLGSFDIDKLVSINGIIRNSTDTVAWSIPTSDMYITDDVGVKKLNLRFDFQDIDDYNVNITLLFDSI